MRAILLAAGVSVSLASAARAQDRYLAVDVAAVGYLSERNAALGGQVGIGSGTLAGGELNARMGLFGGRIRFFGGTFTADSGLEAEGEIHEGDVELYAGPRVFSPSVGYGLRSFTGGFATRRWSFVRLGGRSSVPIGATGLSANISAFLYAGVTGAESTGSGHELETRLTYATSRMPVLFSIGYRFEQFTVDDPLDSRPEEVGSIVFAAGVRLGQLFGGTEQ
jgi:hypothetical protein